MNIPVSASLYGVGVGTSSSVVPYVSNVSPTSRNIQGPTGPFQIGQKWVNSAANITFILTSISSFNGVTTANWLQEGGAQPGGVYSVTGTPNQITATPTTGNVVLSLPDEIITTSSLYVGQGILAVDTATFTSNITSTNFTLDKPDSKIIISNIADGTDAVGYSNGMVALVAGEVTVQTDQITHNSQILFTCQSLGTITTPASLAVTSKTVGTGFTITSSENTDTSTIFWMIIG